MENQVTKVNHQKIKKTEGKQKGNTLSSFPACVMIRNVNEGLGVFLIFQTGMSLRMTGLGFKGLM